METTLLGKHSKENALDDYALIPLKSSIFYGCTSNYGYSTNVYTTENIKKVIRRQATQKRIDEIVTKSRHKHFLSTTFSGVYKDANVRENFVSYSKLCWLRFIKLSKKQRSQMIDDLKKDIHTHLLFKTFDGIGLNLVIKVDANRVEEYESCFDQLCINYTTRFGLNSDQVDYKCREVNTLCHLPYDPNIYYNAESEWFHPTNQLPQEITVESKAVKQIADTQRTVFSTDTNDTNENVEQIISYVFADHYYLAKLPEINKYCMGKYLQITDKNCSLNIPIQTSTNWNQDSQAWELNYFMIKDKKKIHSVNFVHDLHLNTTLVNEKKTSNSKPTNRKQLASIPAVCQSLLTLLNNQELEQGVTQRQLAEIHHCSYETIRDRVEEIFKKPFLIRETTGKPYVLVKRLKRPSHFLSLNPID